MEISNQIGWPHVDPTGIPAGSLPGAGTSPKGVTPWPSLTLTQAPVGIGPADGTDGIPSAALDAALRRDDDLGKFVNSVLGTLG